MERMGSVVISLAAIVAVCTAAVVAMKFTGPGWRATGAAAVRLIRSESDHPRWEALAQ